MLRCIAPGLHKTTLPGLARRASTRMNREMTERVLRAPLSFFHTNPGGRILNRSDQNMFIPTQRGAKVFAAAYWQSHTTIQLAPPLLHTSLPAYPMLAGGSPAFQ